MDPATVEAGEDAEGAVYATRAARRALGLEDFHWVPPPATFLSPMTARALFSLMIRLRLEASSE